SKSRAPSKPSKRATVEKPAKPAAKPPPGKTGSGERGHRAAGASEKAAAGKGAPRKVAGKGAVARPAPPASGVWSRVTAWSATVSVTTSTPQVDGPFAASAISISFSGSFVTGPDGRGDGYGVASYQEQYVWQSIAGEVFRFGGGGGGIQVSGRVSASIDGT